MNEFENELRSVLSDGDQQFLKETLDETGFYKDVFNNLKGPGGGLNIAAWIAVFVMSALLIFCLIKAFHAETTREQILFATIAIMGNSAQIAFKMWINMRMNRRAILTEIHKLRLSLTQQNG